MNVLMLASDNNFSSGAFRSMTVLCKLLKEKGVKITVIIPKKGDGIRLLEENDVDYIMIRSEDWIVSKQFKLKKYIKKIIKMNIYNYKAVREIRKIIKEKDIDIVHLNTSWCYVGAKAAIKENKKLIWHIREFLEEDQNNKIIFRKQGLKLMAKSDKIVCISKSIYEKYSQIFNNNKLEMIYNGIAVETFYNKSKEIFTDKNNIKMVCVGGISKKKGQRELVEALGQAKKYIKEYNIELELVGGYSEEEKNVIEKIINKYNLHKNVIFKGKCSNISEIYSEADIAFMCSLSEAFGRVTVEAMMSGCLVIGKNSAGTSEIISNNETGILYNNIEELSQKIIYAIENKKKMKSIANNGREFAKNIFSAKQNADNIYYMYENLLNKDRNENETK